MNAINDFVASFAQDAFLTEDSYDAGPKDYNYIEMARDGLEILRAIELDCLVAPDPRRPENKLWQATLQRMAYIDTEITLALAEVSLSEISDGTIQTYWLHRLRELRDRAQPVYVKFKRLVLAEDGNMSAADFADRRQSPYHAWLELVTKRLDNLGRFITRLE